MTTVIERTEGHYEVREIPYGKDYVWCPECVVVECDCGEKASLTATETICECGADHTAFIQAELKSRTTSGEKTPCPDDECREWRKHEGEYLHSEQEYEQEWKRLR